MLYSVVLESVWNTGHKMPRRGWVGRSRPTCTHQRVYVPNYPSKDNKIAHCVRNIVHTPALCTE